MKQSRNYVCDDAEERNHHVGAIQNAGSLATDKHGEGLDSSGLVGLGVESIVGMEHRYGDKTDGNRQDHRFREEAAGDGVCRAEYRQDSENDEDVQVAERMILEEGVQRRQQHSHAADYQQPGAAQQRYGDSCGASGNKQYDAEP